MGELSRFWTTNGTGDGAAGGYTQAQFAEFVRQTLMTDTTTEGVLKGIGGELAVTSASGSVNVATGSGLVYGLFYANDATVNIAVANTAASSRIDRIVLRANLSATTGDLPQTIRIKKSDGVAGTGVPPALVQSPTGIFEIPLATVTVSAGGGTITVTDARTFVKTPGTYGYLDDANIINALQLASNSVIEAKINAGAVTETKIGSGAVTETKIGSGAVTEIKIGSGAVTADKIGSSAVIEAKIGSGAVTVTKIGAGAVTSAKIGQNQVFGGTTGNIALTTITDGNIVSGTITGAKIDANTITGGTTGNIALTTITADNLASNSVIEAKINAGAVTVNKIGAGAVTSAKIGQNQVFGGASGNIALTTITADNIATNAVTNAKIIDDAITSAKILDYAVIANAINTNAVTEAKINAGAVTSAKILGDAVTGQKLGDYAPKFGGRQGGSALDWPNPGTNRYDNPISTIAGGDNNEVAISAGSIQISIVSSSSGTASVTFYDRDAGAGAMYSANPIVLVTPNGSTDYIIDVSAVSSTGATIRATHKAGTSATTNVTVWWMSIGSTSL